MRETNERKRQHTRIQNVINVKLKNCHEITSQIQRRK